MDDMIEDELNKELIEISKPKNFQEVSPALQNMWRIYSVTQPMRAKWELQLDFHAWRN